MVTLAALILLSGLLALILLFDEQIFAFFRSQMSQRKILCRTKSSFTENQSAATNAHLPKLAFK